MKILVVAHNRPHSLQRLLASLTAEADVWLSVDGNHAGVLEVATKWPVNRIIRSPNAGLMNHMLACIALAETEGPLVILEDDLWLSPAWFSFATAAVAAYEHSEHIAAVSLYHQHYHALTQFPFYPIADGSSVYFMQYPCSSGFVITPAQAAAFGSWLRQHQGHLPIDVIVPAQVAGWPASSWKKLFAAYLSHTHRFVVFPRMAFCTNFGDAGTHHHHNSSFFQSPLQHIPSAYTLPALHQSPARYDAYMEWCANETTCFDLAGLKPRKHLNREFVVSSKSTAHPIASYGCHLKPAELNYIYQIPGKDFFLCKTEHAAEHPLRKPAHFWHPYYLSDNETPSNFLLRKWRKRGTRNFN